MRSVGVCVGLTPTPVGSRNVGQRSPAFPGPLPALARLVQHKGHASAPLSASLRRAQRHSTTPIPAFRVRDPPFRVWKLRVTTRLRPLSAAGELTARGLVVGGAEG